MTSSTLVRRTTLVGSLLAISLFSSLANAQDVVGNGFALANTQPGTGVTYDTMPNGNRVVFDGSTIDLQDGAGVFIMNLATMPGFVFNSFVEVDPTQSFAIVGESSNGDIFRVALDGSGFSTLGNLFFNYDAVFESNDSILISAATCGFSCGNDLVRMNTTTGATTFLAAVAGNSGPVAVADNGDLFYGTADSSVPSNTSIISWSQAQLNGGALLSESDATVLVSGLENATSMAIDPIFGNILLAESIFGGTSRILEFDASNGNLVDVVIESATYLGSIELIQGSGPGHFHAYQPDGVFMHYNGNDFFGTEYINTIESKRPTATHTQIGPVATFTIEGAEPNGAMLVMFANVNLFNPSYYTTQLSFNFLFHSSVQPFQQRRTPLYIPVDSNGTGVFNYFDPGNLQGTLVFQALVTNASAGFIGSSEAVMN